ncbi:hypothetical protein INS49_012921 [Diaporthe citri]|uniref:uncharacterized protein n=1 Tax=Diaporthe citri TaxID=83186 RepID=UPI001C7E2E98|nr:uncharacterized protein INS49_012921 [Diaporthe citri]KAG6359400.1 hypothetical protein INS49_012921 [Diaporthe citri]
MNECMKALFRIGILVRRDIAYDRFQRALQRSRFSFPEQFDTDYAEQKHPKPRSRGRGLATRLGRANAKRRQFSKYGRDHRTRLEMDVDVRQETKPEPKPTLSIDLEAPTEQLSSKATTFVKPAENWISEFLAPPIEDQDDSALLLTASTTFDSKRSLKSHAYHDLKAYICTYGGKHCDTEMFVDRATWFNHELTVHRSLFTCKLCADSFRFFWNKADSGRHNDKFDLIFMDIQMPRLSGLANTHCCDDTGVIRHVNEVMLKPFRKSTIRKVLQRFAIVAGDAGKPSERAGNDSDISSVTALIAEALSGPGKVKTAGLIDLLPNLHHHEIMNLRTEYKRLVKVGPERKGVNVGKHIRARLKDDDNRLMTAAYATALARKGQQLLIESLLGRSNTEARLIEDGFRIHSNKLEREHGTSLETFLDPYLRQGEAWFREAVNAVLSGHKMEERDHSGQPQPIDMQLVEKDVDELFEAVAGDRGAATTISQIVILRSDAHLREVLTIYQRKYESDFIADALRGTMQLRDYALYHVLYGVLNRPTRDAWLLHQALTPSGDDGIQHEVLTSRLVRAHWNGHYLSAVKQAYREQYGQHLVDDIAAGTSGEWGAFCVALAQSNLQWDERPRDRHATM